MDDIWMVRVLLVIPIGMLLTWGIVLLVDWFDQHQHRQSYRGPVDDTAAMATLIYRDGVLLDANAEGHALLLGVVEHASDWTGLGKLLAARFPGFPPVQTCKQQSRLDSYKSCVVDDPAFVTVQHWDDIARVIMQQPRQSWQRPGFTQPLDAPVLTLTEAPYPVWQSNGIGQLVWANATYLRLAETLEVKCENPELPVFFDPSAQENGTSPVRTSVYNKDRTQTHWFDITTANMAGMRTHYATPADAMVSAEIAQRNFVQTLTKTFAQLSIGLVIFDRNRQLALFNPSLIDLTNLPADFLSSRPNLLTFFDRMRENRMMPEPRNYASWREQIAELVVAASDDRYTDTWTLPCGVTYRVLGRPHPDGAIAFLFEDISAEVSLTRRFRTELELGQQALDSVQDALVVFSPTGKLSLCNQAYRDLWRCEPEQSVTEYCLQDAMLLWRNGTKKTKAWEKLRHHALDMNPRDSWTAEVTLESGPAIGLRVTSLHAGFTSVLFESGQVSDRTLSRVESVTS